MVGIKFWTTIDRYSRFSASCSEQAHISCIICRNVFPLATTKSDAGCRLKWDELCSALRSPPLGFKVSNIDRNILKFHRAACDGWPAGVITIHKGHGLNPRLEKHDLDLIRKDLRKEFGWTADDFVLAEQKEVGTGSEEP